MSTGTPVMAADFRTSLGLDAEVWTDRKRSSYRQLGFTRSVGSTLLNWNTLKHGARALRKGFRQGKTQGDPWQQGGVLVVDRGRVLYEYASAEAGDHPPVEDVIRNAVAAFPPGD